MYRHRSVALAVGMLLCGFLSAEAAPPPSPAAGDGTEKQEPAKPESLDVRYARAQLALAEAALKNVESMNKQVANVISGDDVVAYQQDLEMARLQLQVALGGDPAGEFSVWLRRAEGTFKKADSLWQGAAGANKKVADVIRPTEVERLRLRAEVAKLQWERGQSLAHGSVEQQAAWKLSLLASEVRWLEEDMRRITPASRTYPYWRY